MRIAMTGGTGTLGSLVAAELAGRGHDAVCSAAAPRSTRWTSPPGSGLPSALTGCDVVVDASNNASRHAAEVLVSGTRRLLAGVPDPGRP
jgi:putative NADH-flavin reductase